MPIYEYACKKCGHELEAIQKISADPLKKCPKCSKLSLQRLISATSFRLKGSGWYETDFKHKGKAKPASKEKESSNTTQTSKPTDKKKDDKKE